MDPALPDMLINTGTVLQRVGANRSNIDDNWDTAAKVGKVVPPLNQLRQPNTKKVM